MDFVARFGVMHACTAICMCRCGDRQKIAPCNNWGRMWNKGYNKCKNLMWLKQYSLAEVTFAHAHWYSNTDFSQSTRILLFIIEATHYLHLWLCLQVLWQHNYYGSSSYVLLPVKIYFVLRHGQDWHDCESYSYAQKHHKNYNRCYKNYPMKVDEWVLRWTSQRQRWWL